jgi:lysyl-tRNA synthetase class I
MDCCIQGIDPIFVPCDHEYLNFKGAKLSKSRGTAVEVPYFLSKYDPDALRFYLTATAPETRDTEACPACTLPQAQVRDSKGSPGRISSSATTLS